MNEGCKDDLGQFPEVESKKETHVIVQRLANFKLAAPEKCNNNFESVFACWPA